MAAVHHVALNCRDRQASTRFYETIFGFKLVRVFNAGQPSEFVMLRCGACCLELFSASADQPAGEQAVGFKHLAFEVDDVAAEAARVRAYGLETGEVIDCTHIVPELKVCFFKDPDGNVLELMEHPSDDPALA